MKVVFLCGSLEPGCDGVGDYIRRLGTELIKNGHQAVGVALNEPSLSTDRSEMQRGEGIEFRVLRLPCTYSLDKRLFIAKRWIRLFDPEWISVQYVPFAFHKKGLHLGLACRLKNLGNGCRWHIMFHELWMGIEKGAAWKNRLWGYVQRKLIKDLITKLQPAVIHTHTQLYLYFIKRMGFYPSFLPLFGNIPLHHSSQIRSRRSSDTEEHPETLTFVIFGGIHYGAPVESFTDEVAAYCRTRGVSAVLVLIGNCGAEQRSWIDAWRVRGLSAEQLGVQPPERISAVLQNASIGIVTTPMFLVEKSGSMAAMREHGLPVVCVSRSWQPRLMNGIHPSRDVIEYQPGILYKVLSGLCSKNKARYLSEIANQFVKQLNV